MMKRRRGVPLTERWASDLLDDEIRFIVIENGKEKRMTMAEHEDYLTKRDKKQDK